MSAHDVFDPEDGRRAVEAFIGWAARNRSKWFAIFGAVRDMAEAHAVIQRGTVYSWAIGHGVDVGDAEDIRRDNNLWPAMSRYCIKYLGDDCGIRTRASCIDDAYPTPADLPELPRALRP